MSSREFGVRPNTFSIYNPMREGGVEIKTLEESSVSNPLAEADKDSDGDDEGGDDDEEMGRVQQQPPTAREDKSESGKGEAEPLQLGQVVVRGGEVMSHI